MKSGGSEVKMKLHSLPVPFLVAALLINSWFDGSAHSQTPSPDLLKAKQQAEAKGYIFLTNHDEIVEKAKKEGKLRVLSSQQSVTIKPSSTLSRRNIRLLM